MEGLLVVNASPTALLKAQKRLILHMFSISKFIPCVSGHRPYANKNGKSEDGF